MKNEEIQSRLSADSSKEINAAHFGYTSIISSVAMNISYAAQLWLMLYVFSKHRCRLLYSINSFVFMNTTATKLDSVMLIKRLNLLYKSFLWS